jgi:D-amino-acid dehydrogenase
MQVVVIGGGVIGLWSARSLLEAGVSVTVLDRPTDTSVATSASAGWVVPALSQPLSGPGVVQHTVGQVLRRQAAFSLTPTASIARWLLEFLRSGRPHTFHAGLTATLGLAAAALPGYTGLRASGVDLEEHQDGLLVVARTARGLEHAVELAQNVETAGYAGKYDVLTADELARRDPALAPAAGGVHLRDEIHVRPEQLLSALRSEVERLGGVLREGGARLVARDAHGWKVSTGTGTLSADKVIVAAGYWSRTLLSDLGVRVPLESAAGVSVTMAGGGRPAYPLKLVEADVAVTPFDGGVRLAGRFALGSAPSAPSRRQLARVVDAARPYLRDWSPGSVQLEQVGLRPVTPDSLPLVGEPRGHPGLVVATGHGMLGLTLAPGTAAEVAHQVVHGVPTAAGAAFDPNRFR